MKITRFRIENYRGIRDAHAEDLTRLPFVIMTGRNGTGKSLILEALAAVWAGEINLPDLVGPYSNSLSVELAIELSDGEYESLEQWLDDTGQGPIERREEHVLQAVATSTQETGHYVQRDGVIESLQSRYFADNYSFANIDLLSARRQPTLNAEIGVDLNLLDAGQNALQRRQMMQDEIRWKNAQHMPDVGSYLTALDYREYVARRNDGLIPGEYDRLQEAFRHATGKTISRPNFDPNTGRPEIVVEVPSGVTHGLADLSNGEREMIGMFYYISQLASRGGVLLLDEPERHLHPTLQSAVLEAITSLAGQGQALIVTHSPTIVATIPQEQICSVRGAWEVAENQLRWASDSQDAFEPLAEVGIQPKDLLQMEAILVVEGQDDANRLQMLFVEELSRVKVLVAGGRDRALSIYHALGQADVGVPHLCVVDRDFLSSDEASALEKKGVFVWGARMLENVLLHAPLIAEAAGKPEDYVIQIIHDCAAELRANAITVFTEHRTLKLPVESPDGEFSGLRGHIEDQIFMWQQRLKCGEQVAVEVKEELENAWEESWHRYVDGKKLIGAVNAKLGVYRDKVTFIEHLIRWARLNKEKMPPELHRFEQRLLESTSPVIKDISSAKPAESDLEVRVRRELTDVEPDSRLNISDWHYGGCFGQ
ncbi:AAA family ATPase [Citricoccus sp. NR2]|uniref:AAA family ATPase n=1 Tax=Citricoccus sp. NR2 TaxID=3004095 RepID=UPI0022DD7550|nr:AAA family ATPase [Citricoccus sp. NR2]WBL19762.1 AAA family ATPase [Citricoccus sp. NR2]